MQGLVRVKVTASANGLELHGEAAWKGWPELQEDRENLVGVEVQPGLELFSQMSGTSEWGRIGNVDVGVLNRP